MNRPALTIARLMTAVLGDLKEDGREEAAPWEVAGMAVLLPWPPI